MIASLARKRAAWRRRAPRVRRLFGPSWLLLGLAQLAIMTLPFRLIARWLGRECGQAVFTPVLNGQQTDTAREIGQAIALAARYTPWASLCHPQALVARFWLRRYGIPCVVHYGLCKADTQALAAHAWVCAGAVAVSGGQSWETFVVVRSFVCDGRKTWPLM